MVLHAVDGEGHIKCKISGGGLCSKFDIDVGVDSKEKRGEQGQKVFKLLVVHLYHYEDQLQSSLLTY